VGGGRKVEKLKKEKVRFSTTATVPTFEDGDFTGPHVSEALHGTEVLITVHNLVGGVAHDVTAVGFVS